MDTALLIEKLNNTHSLNKDEALQLIKQGAQHKNLLFALAQKTAQKSFGRQIFVRGLIEFTNYCKNDCYYCGIRRSNKNAARYRLTQEEILEATKMPRATALRRKKFWNAAEQGTGLAFAPLFYRAARIIFTVMRISPPLYAPLKRNIRTAPLPFPSASAAVKPTPYGKKLAPTVIFCATKRQIVRITPNCTRQN